MDPAVPVLARYDRVIPIGVLPGAKPEVSADRGPQRRKTYQPYGFLNKNDLTRPGDLRQVAFHHDGIGQITGRTQRRRVGAIARLLCARTGIDLSLIHISEPTRLLSISYAVFCLLKKK